MDSTTTNGVIALTLLTCATPFILAALALLWLGPSRMPAPVRKQWEALPAQARMILRRAQPVVWLLIGIIVGSSLINPIARWLRTLTP